MQQLQYTENYMRTFTYNATANYGCGLRVRTEIWELDLETYRFFC